MRKMFKGMGKGGGAMQRRAMSMMGGMKGLGR
jgi:signal recognition particle subunit SRP54